MPTAAAPGATGPAPAWRPAAQPGHGAGAEGFGEALLAALATADAVQQTAGRRPQESAGAGGSQAPEVAAVPGSHPDAGEDDLPASVPEDPACAGAEDAGAACVAAGPGTQVAPGTAAGAAGQSAGATPVHGRTAATPAADGLEVRRPPAGGGPDDGAQAGATAAPEGTGVQGGTGGRGVDEPDGAAPSDAVRHLAVGASGADGAPVDVGPEGDRAAGGAAALAAPAGRGAQAGAGAPPDGAASDVAAPPAGGAGRAGTVLPSDGRTGVPASAVAAGSRTGGTAPSVEEPSQPPGGSGPAGTDAAGPRAEAAPVVGGSSPGGDVAMATPTTSERVGGGSPHLAARVAAAAELLRAGARRLVVDADGVRVSVAVAGDAVRVLVLDGAATPAWGRDLAAALAARGLRLAGDGGAHLGGGSSGRREDRGEPMPDLRPTARATAPRPGGTAVVHL